MVVVWLGLGTKRTLLVLGKNILLFVKINFSSVFIYTGASRNHTDRTTVFVRLFLMPCIFHSVYYCILQYAQRSLPVIDC